MNGIERFSHSLMGNFERGSDANCQSRTFRTGPPALLLMTAPQQRRKFNSSAKQKKPDPLGGMELMTADAERRDSQIVKVDGDFADGLGSIAMEQSFHRQLRNEFPNRLNRAGFMVDEHQTAEAGRGVPGARRGAAGEPVDVEPLCGELMERFHYAGMFD